MLGLIFGSLKGMLVLAGVTLSSVFIAKCAYDRKLRGEGHAARVQEEREAIEQAKTQARKKTTDLKSKWYSKFGVVIEKDLPLDPQERKREICRRLMDAGEDISR